MLEEKMKRKGLTKEEVWEELNRRKIVLDWMVKKGIRQYTDVVSVIRDYYADPIRIFRKARVGIS
jgi:flagellar protein FlaI